MKAPHLTRIDAAKPLTHDEGFIDLTVARTLNDMIAAVKEIVTELNAATGQHALVNSYVAPRQILTSDTSAVDSTKAKVEVAAHTRVYADGSTASVAGGTVDLLTFGTTYFIYYDDASRTGGMVAYSATTSATSSVQNGDRHACGYITTPASSVASATTGKGPPPSGIDWATS